MTTSTNPTDDIIELTEIVEEGIPLDKKFEDFAMDKAVDAKSLDQELDDLLRDADPQSKPAAREAGDEIDLDILFEEPVAAAPKQPTPAPAKPQAADPGMDISDLDDLFDSLGIGEDDKQDTALDIILDGDLPEPRKQGHEAFYPSDSIDLELEIPGMDTDEKNSNILDLSEDLLADVPETVLLEPADKPIPKPATEEPETKLAQQDPSLEDPAMQPAAELAAEPAEATVAEPESPVGDKPGQLVAEQEAPQEEMDEPAPIHEAQDLVPAAAPETGTDIETKQSLITAEQIAAMEPGISNAELEIISARLDALESRPEPSPAPGADELLALLPQSPQELPVTQNLRQEILEHLESRITELASSSSVDGLQESVNALQSQIEAFPDIRAELAMASPASELQKLQADLDEVRALIQPREELQPEQILALLPQSPEGWPVAQALRQEIVEHVESRISELASSSSVDGLQESVNALQSQVESIPDIRAELAKAPAASVVQKMETELDELKTLVRNQDETLGLLRQTLADRDAAIDALTAEEESLREELRVLSTKVNDAPTPDAIKSELHEYVQQQVPLAAAKIIREEIQALLKELGG